MSSWYGWSSRADIVLAEPGFAAFDNGVVVTYGLGVVQVHVRGTAGQVDQDHGLGVVIVLGPLLERVMVARGAREPHGDEPFRKLVYKSASPGPQSPEKHAFRLSSGTLDPINVECL
jgi:hypothetical protein